MDIDLHDTQRGSGFPLVLLHGNGEESGYFLHQLEHFAQTYRVIAVDTRGHGQSPRGSAPFTLEQFALDLKEFLDGRGLRRVHLLGFSDGANIALLFALRYPQCVRRLILNGANLSPRGVKLYVQLPIVLGYTMVSLISKFDSKALAKREILGLMVKEPHITFDQLGQISLPTLVIAGKRDMIRDSHTRKIAAAIPGARLVFLEGDHFIAAKRSDAFNREVDAFLSSEP